MNMKSFLLGIVVGVALTLAGAYCYSYVKEAPIDAQADKESDSPFVRFDKPKSYENKKETSFKVLQVFEDAALANEASDRIGRNVMYLGNVVMILGEDYYSDQIVTVRNPVILGTYSYTANNGMPKTVPVIDGEMK